MIIILKVITKQQQKQQNTIYNGRNGQINLDDHNNNEDDDYDVKNYVGEITVLTTNDHGNNNGEDN